MRFLVVDDEPSIAALTAGLIAKAGHEPSLAADGFAAIKLAAELPPEIVLLDIEMPGINGYQTAKRLRDRHGKNFSIFAVTATPVDLLLAEQSGFDGVFSKSLSENARGS
jgi:CheY-like chemotaxis protein